MKLSVCLMAALFSMALPALRADDTICTGSLSGRHENVIVPDGANCTISNARIDGNVKVETGSSLTVEGPTYIGGNVQSEGSRFVRLNGGGVTVNGDVQIKKASEASGIQPGTNIYGNFQYEENTAFLFASGAFIRGDFQMFKNFGGANIVNNTIRQNMQCKENYPAPAGGGNRAGKKEDQCSAL